MTAGFLVFWFAIGSVFAMIVSFFTENIIVQASIFLISSIILIFATRKFVNHFLKQTESSNINSFVGQTGRVTVDIDPLTSQGQIKVGGETWTAISESGKNIQKDTEVIITKITGVKAVVKPK